MNEDIRRFHHLEPRRITLTRTGHASASNMPFSLFSVILSILAFTAQQTGLPLLAFGFALAGSMCLDVALWKGFIKDSGFSLALKICFAFLSLRKIFPLVMCIISIPLPTESIPWGFAILKNPAVAVLGYSIEGWCAALVLFLGQSLTMKRAVGLSDVAALARHSNNFGWFLGLAAVTSLVWWLAITEFDNKFFFFVRRFHNALG